MHSQPQTVQKPFSAEFTPVCLHPTVQLPGGERRRQVATALTRQKAAPPPHTHPYRLAERFPGEQEEVVRGGTGKSLIPFLIQGQFLCTPCPWIAIFILNLVPRRGGHSSVLLHWYSDSEIRSEFRRRKVSASGAVTQTEGSLSS